MADRIQLRRDSAAAWEGANPVLSDGEIGIERDTDQFKVGDGVTAWTALAYGGLQGPQGDEGPQGEQGPKGDPGDDGNTWHSGEGSPSDTIGVNGDFYLDTLNRAYWGPKAAGTWTGTGPEYLDAAPVQSVHGRTGTVTAQTGDYTAAQVGADPEGSAAAAETAANSYTDSHAAATDEVHGIPLGERALHTADIPANHPADTGGIHGIPEGERALNSEELLAAVSEAADIDEAVSFVGRGAIVESDTNANGSYIRWENGEQVSFLTSTLDQQSSNRVAKALDFPAAFASTPKIICFVHQSGSTDSYDTTTPTADQLGHIGARADVTTTTRTFIAQYRVAGQTNFTAGDTIDVNVVAWGFWK